LDEWIEIPQTTNEWRAGVLCASWRKGPPSPWEKKLAALAKMIGLRSKYDPFMVWSDALRSTERETGPHLNLQQTTEEGMAD